jgi:hypothetical protein
MRDLFLLIARAATGQARALKRALIPAHCGLLLARRATKRRQTRFGAGVGDIIPAVRGKA